MRAITVALIFLCAAGCGGAAVVPDSTVPGRYAPAAASGLIVTPVLNGYLRGDASGLTLWGSDTWAAVVHTANRADTIAATSADPSSLVVTPGRMRNHFLLHAPTVERASATCPNCRVVRAGRVDLRIVVSSSGRAHTYHVPVTIAHKIVAITLNPLPNPSLGGSDAVLQYYDDNVSPSVVWDDFDLNNAHTFVNVGGLAFGADGSLYIAN